MSAPRIICLAGPTGTGKTETSLILARRLGGAVVNFDSRQVYRGLGIVTAQPTAAERGEVPHYLYGFLPPDREVSAGVFAKKVRSVVRHLLKKGLVPILAGGTGLYLKAILGGLDEIPPIPDEVRARVQAQWEQEGPQALRARLEEIDPGYAAKIHPNDRQRTTRALEVALHTGRPFSSWHGQGQSAGEYQALVMGLRLDREVLADRLETRIEAMLDAGALAETRRVMETYPPDARALTGIGCAELCAHLRGEMDLAGAKALWLKNTKAYAKRQMVWFKKEEGLIWFPPGGGEAMAELAAVFLAGA